MNIKLESFNYKPTLASNKRQLLVELDGEKKLSKFTLSTETEQKKVVRRLNYAITRKIYIFRR